ncbi:conserved hypothetical protein [Ricinus communis]|uniref:Uncharacterized protein n=1 Tax=Ricinus communis TaxID=3988 RepID=B9RWM2_RICCO|nr:conserved hypothetical protein [Ricinus communis]|eukprot:XP_025012919.1 UPF0481 protein At3g47200-like [Ricinus communis]
MGTEELDCVAISINEKLGSLSPLSSDRCIFKVPNQVRVVNEKAYAPEIIAIGPYHRGKDHLKAMEEHKIRYLQRFLRRSHQNSVLGIVQAIRALEETARNCYSEPVSLTQDEFVEMMVVDGCFIVEFSYRCVETADPEDPIFQTNQIQSRLMLDLLLVENQLPFFVLIKLFHMITGQENSIIKLLLKVFKFLLPGRGYNPKHEYTSEQIGQIRHLLELIHDNWQPLPTRMESYLNMRENVKRSFPRCAIELQEAGIKFKKVEEQNLFDISFRNGVMRIPTLTIRDETQCIMRNLIAYEQLIPRSSPIYVSDYMIFMDSLINSEKDVELLCRKGIIENWLGDDKAVAILCNKIGDNVFCDRALYAEIQYSVNMHCNKRWNVWMAKLRHNYFHSPWALISVLAAIILLFLTFSQTLYSVFSYYK